MRVGNLGLRGDGHRNAWWLSVRQLRLPGVTIARLKPVQPFKELVDLFLHRVVAGAVLEHCPEPRAPVCRIGYRRV